MLRLGKNKRNVYRKAVLVHARDAIRCPIQSFRSAAKFIMHLAHNLPPFISRVTSKLKARLKSYPQLYMYGTHACVCVCVFRVCTYTWQFLIASSGENESRIKSWTESANRVFRDKGELNEVKLINELLIVRPAQTPTQVEKFSRYRKFWVFGKVIRSFGAECTLELNACGAS